jgi:uncharacterized lipoprotein YddW (UPF0748 family)
MLSLRLLFCGLFFFAFFKAYASSDIVVVKPVVAIDKSSRSYAASVGSHIARWLGEGGVKCVETDDTALANALAGRKLAFLVAFSKPTSAQMAVLRKYVMRGGKVCAFYCSSPDLARLAGVSLGSYKKGGSPSVFSRVRFQGGSLPGAPDSIRQDTSAIFEAFPLKGVSTTIASWRSVSGAYSGAAVIASSKGWWVSALLQGKGDEKSKTQFLLALVDKAIPGRWNRKAWAAAENKKASDAKRIGAAQRPKPGELHAVWDHSGEGYYPGDWARTIALLKKHGITDIFVNVAGAGFAHYDSKILPRSGTYFKRGDQLGACIAAARGSGVRVHAWILCFSAARSAPDAKAGFAKKGWMLSNPKGGAFDYLDPSNPAVRSHLAKAIDEIAARYPVDGVHLDFVRWNENLKATEKTAGAMKRFKAESKINSLTALHSWREGKIRAFVKAVSANVKKKRPKAVLSTAVLASYPSCVRSVGQDWVSWINSGAVDFVVPMNYTDDIGKYNAFLSRQVAASGRARKIVSGIGVTANESRLSAVDAINQINASRNAGVAGVALFDLNQTLAEEILPVLSLGIFKRQ